MRNLTRVFIFLFSAVLLPLFGITYPLDLSFIGFNDAMTVGIAQNADDLRSYGALFSFRFESGLVGQVDVAALTARNSLIEEGGQRYDEMTLFTGYLHTFHIPRNRFRFEYSVIAGGGGVLAGNLGLQSVQNFWHDMNGIPLVILPYCEEELKFYPHLAQSQKLRALLPIPWFSDTEFYLDLIQSASFSPEYSASIALQVNAGQYTDDTRDIAIGIGFNILQSLDEIPLHHLLEQYEGGFFLELAGRMGLAEFFFRTYLQSGTGWGGVGFNLGSSLQDRKVTGSNEFSLAFSLMFPGKLMSLSLSYPLSEHLNIRVMNAFDDYILDITTNARENISRWYLGLEYEMGNPYESFALPFFSLSGGFRRIALFANDPVLERRDSYFSALSPLINGEFGLRFFSDGRFTLQGNSYAIELASTVAAAPSSSLSDAIETYGILGVRTIDVTLRLGIVITGSL